MSLFNYICPPHDDSEDVKHSRSRTTRYLSLGTLGTYYSLDAQSAHSPRSQPNWGTDPTPRLSPSRRPRAFQRRKSHTVRARLSALQACLMAVHFHRLTK